MLENCHPLKQPTPQCRPPPIPQFPFASELWIVSSQTNAWMHTRTRHTCRHHYIQTTGPPYIQSQTVYMCLDKMYILFTFFLPFHSQIHVCIYTQVHKYTVCILPLVYTSVNTHKVLGQLVPGPSVFPLRSLAVEQFSRNISSSGRQN